MGRLNVPLGVLTVTTRVAICAWVDINDDAVVQWSGAVLSSLRITGSPGWML